MSKNCMKMKSILDSRSKSNFKAQTTKQSPIKHAGKQTNK